MEIEKSTEDVKVVAVEKVDVVTIKMSAAEAFSLEIIASMVGGSDGHAISFRPEQCDFMNELDMDLTTARIDFQ